jgi:hypothetical protein
MLMKVRMIMSDDNSGTGGFYIVDNVIIKEYGAKVGPYGIAVYSVLAMYANGQGGGIYPAYQTIADQLGISRTKVITTINLLCDLGLVEKQERMRKGGGSSSNSYRIARGTRHVPRNERVVDGVHDSDPRGTPRVPHGVHDSDPRGTPRVPDQDPIDQYPQDQDPERETARAATAAAPQSSGDVVKLGSPYMPKGMHLPRGYVPRGTGTNAVQVYYERFSPALDDERLSAPQEDDLYYGCQDLDLLRNVLERYANAGYKNKRNLNLVFDWYRDGIPQHRNKTSGNTNQHTRAAPMTNVERSLQAVENVFARIEAEGIEAWQ